MTSTFQRLALALLASVCSSCGEARSAQETDAEETWNQQELEALAKRIQSEIEELRGAKFQRPVAVRVASREDFQEHVKQRLAMTETPEKIAADEAIAKLLGVIPPDMDLMATFIAFAEDQVGGFYDPLSDSFSLMDVAPKGLAGVILSHELGHALDDQLHELDGPILELSGHTDASLAYQALVEGSGTSLMNQWTLQHLDEIDLAGSDALMQASMESISTAPMWIWKPLVAVYMCGAAFLAKTDNALLGQMRPVPPADIETAFAKPPRSTEQVLHPEKYWDPERLDEPRSIVFEIGELPEGWSLAREDTLGELMLSILCTLPEKRGGLDASNPAAIIGVQFTNDLAQGWAGDRVALLTNGEERLLRLVTLWDTERDAAEFHGALALLLPTFEAAAAALSAGDASDSGAELVWGAEGDEVVLTVRSGVERRDLRKIEKALDHQQR